MSDDHKAQSDFTLVGTPMRKLDGLSKSTGRAKYTDDITLPGMLHGKILRSPHPHARILSIDTSKAETLPGVHGVVVGSEMPVTFGVIPWTPDEYPLCVDRVRYIGDGVAAVAAVDEDTALEALALIDVEYEPLPAYLDPFAALEADGSIEAPYLHEPRKEGWNGNVTKMVELEFGELDAGFEAADLVVEGDYLFEGTSHTPIEPHCAIGLWEPDGVPYSGSAEGGGLSFPEMAGMGGQPGKDPDPRPVETRGKLTVWSATQVPHYVHRELARVLKLDPARIRVIQPPVGGAFGGKSDPFSLEFCVAKLAMLTGRPVKMLWTREEVFYAHRGRHPMRLDYRSGVTKDGKVTAVDAKILIDGGAYSSFGLVTTYYAGQLLTGPYDFPAYRFDSTRVFTNKPPCGPKRGHGSVQPRFAFEVQLDELAEGSAWIRSSCAAQLAWVNTPRPSTASASPPTVSASAWMSVERASDWKKRCGKLPFGRGLGVAGSMYISGTNYPVYPNKMPQSGIQLKVDRSGLVSVFTGAQRHRAGLELHGAYLVAEELGMDPMDVRVHAADTDLCPVDLGAYSSRVTFMLGNAAIDAARKLRRRGGARGRRRVGARRAACAHGPRRASSTERTAPG
jgi:4-hydroxybenzoyl-CoA reductase subunit alpha